MSLAEVRHPMHLLEELRAEHVVIERTLGSLRTYVEARMSGAADASDAAAFVRFFRLYAGHYHHAREEDTLFPALLANLSIREDSGPVWSLLDQHASIAKLLDGIEPLLGGPLADATFRARLADLSGRHRRDLLAHIDAENSVLLPEAESRLRLAGVNDLAGRAPSEAERAALTEAERLTARWAPSVDPEVIRGEGCVICPSYGVTCEGVEREWWSEDEWEDFRERSG